MTLRLKNPHSILAALKTRPRDVIEVRAPAKGGADAWAEVRALAQENRVPIKTGQAATADDNRKKHGRRGGKRSPDAKTGRLGAGEALVRELPGVTLGQLFDDATNRAGGRGLWVAVDCIQDPHNLGAIVRTASFFGVEGLLLTADRTAPLSATVYDVAAGGLEFLPFSIQTNLARSLAVAKEAGIWILGASEHAEQDLTDIPRERPWLLAVGNEAKGLRRLTAESCDQMCRITPKGDVRSLNASVAAGILIAGLST